MERSGTRDAGQAGGLTDAEHVLAVYPTAFVEDYREQQGNGTWEERYEIWVDQKPALFCIGISDTREKAWTRAWELIQKWTLRKFQE